MSQETIDRLEEQCKDYEARLRKLEQPKWGLWIAAISPALVIGGLIFAPLWSALDKKASTEALNAHKELFINHQSSAINRFGGIEADILQLRKEWFEYKKDKETNHAKNNPTIQ